MKYSQRHEELNSQFEMGNDMHLDTTNIDIRFFPFQSELKSLNAENPIIDIVGQEIIENQEFRYPIFTPPEVQKYDKAILLLHGLNERNWSKYLVWAEHLCNKTRKPVILFPIAYHINRSPQSWSNPRDLHDILNARKNRNGKDRSLSFANVTFSERISEQPYRLYSSGRQSMNDLSQLFEVIKSGAHPLFKQNTHIDFFAYSIGAFLAEITIMTNQNALFTDSKLFMLCGGGIFSSMVGESRCIMDKMAYKNLFQYYLNDFTNEIKLDASRDSIFNSFNSMISPERNKTERELFFKQLGNKVKGISFLRDKVMPYYGVSEALGSDIASSKITKLDFSFDYTHENPFPVGKQFNSTEVDEAFNLVFEDAIEFLGS